MSADSKERNQHDQNNADQVVLCLRGTVQVLKARVAELEAEVAILRRLAYPE